VIHSFISTDFILLRRSPTSSHAQSIILDLILDLEERFDQKPHLFNLLVLRNDLIALHTDLILEVYNGLLVLIDGRLGIVTAQYASSCWNSFVLTCFIGAD